MQCAPSPLMQGCPHTLPACSPHSLRSSYVHKHALLRIAGTVTPSRLCLAAPATQHSRKLLWSARLGFQLTAVLQFPLRSACCMAVHAKIGLKMALQGRPQFMRFPGFYYGLLPALDGGALAAQADLRMLTIHAHWTALGRGPHADQGRQGQCCSLLRPTCFTSVLPLCATLAALAERE